MSSSPHDSLFKAVFGQPEHASGALRAAVPQLVAEAVDWTSLVSRPGSFIDAELASRHTDLLFSASWRAGGEALVYLLFEHQSSSDDLMGFRLLRYLVRIWERWLDEHPLAKKLPVIVPVVLYHDERAWSAPVAFDALLDLPDAVRAALAPHLVTFAFLVDDLSTIPDDELKHRAMTALGRLVEVCFKHARTRPDLIQKLSGWADVMNEVLATPNGLEALELVMRYILQVNEHVEPEEIQAFLERLVPGAKDIVMTAGQRLINQGLEQGREQGVMQGERQFLLRQLKQRFGTQIGPCIEQRVTAASAEQLRIWGSRILSATTLSELLAE